MSDWCELTADERADIENKRATGEWECADCGNFYFPNEDEICSNCSSEFHFVVLDENND